MVVVNLSFLSCGDASSSSRNLGFCWPIARFVIHPLGFIHGWAIGTMNEGAIRAAPGFELNSPTESFIRGWSRL